MPENIVFLPVSWPCIGMSGAMVSGMPIAYRDEAEELLLLRLYGVPFCFP